jgi:TolB-like protein
VPEPASPEFWDRVRTIFQQAIELTPAERARHLEATCGGDTIVRAEVESLLASHDEAGDFIEHPPRFRATFPSGELIAGRYTIVRLLGEGGMGEVYEAEDAELRESVALKIIRPQIASDPMILQRFRREIQLARKVTHPNVCRIFDVFHHLSSSGGTVPERRIAFVSMELLHGETLAQRLARGGRMSAAEALPIVRQLAAGLAAAHEAGIVHRDFKAANVMLVPDADPSRPPRAVITDFGLAQETNARTDGATPLTDPSLLLGTPDYMAPEQVEHGDITPATDLYALGVVMFEMLTGRLPFQGKTPVAVALSRLHQTPPSPRQLARDLDERWEQVILRCLERDPQRRFASTAELVAALDERNAVPRARHKASRLSNTLAALAGIGLLFAALFAIRHAMMRDAKGSAVAARRTASGEPATRRAVAVLGFRNLSGKESTAWMSAAFAEMLTSELAGGERLRPIPGDEVERIRGDLSLGETAQLSPDVLRKIRLRAGANLVVVGSYLAVGDAAAPVRLEVRLHDTEAGSELLAFSESGSGNALPDIAARAGDRLRRALGVEEISTAEQAGVRAIMPANPESMRAYAEGLGQLRRYDAIAARSLLEKSIEDDPSNPMAHTALSQTLSNLGFERAAGEEARKAFELSAKLPRAERLAIEARNRELAHQWPEAIEILRSLVTFYPDELSYRLHLAEVQYAAGKAKDALATIDAARRLPPPLSDDPRLDLVEADAARLATDYPRELAAARRAEQKGTKLGERLVVARAKMNIGYATHDIGNLDAAIVLMRESERLFTEAGDLGGAARAISHQGLYLTSKGELPEASAAFERALGIQRAIGYRSNEARTRNNMANVAFLRGDLEGARRQYAAAYAVSREIDNRSLAAASLGNMGSVQLVEGDLAGARATYAQEIALAQSTDDQAWVFVATSNTAESLRLEGRLAESEETYRRTIAMARHAMIKEYEAYGVAGLAQVRMLRGDLADARKQASDALAMQLSLGAKGSAAETQLTLAAIDLAEAKPAEAETRLRETIAELEHEGAVENQTAAHDLLARTLAAQKKIAAAQEELARAAKLVEGNQTLILHVAHDLVAARVLGAAGRSDAAMARLEAATAVAKRPPYGGALLEARLIRLELGRGGDAHALAADAQRAGFELLARNAERFF